MDYREIKAKSVDEAITKACIDLGIISDRLDYEIIQEASSGFLGFGAKDAIIRYREKPIIIEDKEIIEITETKVIDNTGYDLNNLVSVDDIEARAEAAAKRDKELGIEPVEKKESRDRDNKRGGRNRDRDNRRGGKNRREGGRDRDRDSRRRKASEDVARMGGKIIKEEKPHEPSQPKPQRKVSAKSEEQVAAIKETASTFLKDVFKSMDMDVNIEMNYDQAEGCLECCFDGDDMGILIGKHGQTLDSLQYLTSLVVNKGQEEYIRIKLDTEDYRSRRKETLVNLSRNIAYKVKQTGSAIALEPMNPYERRIIHSALQNNRDVETYSEGEEPYRYVVVTLKK